MLRHNWLSLTFKASGSRECSVEFETWLKLTMGGVVSLRCGSWSWRCCFSERMREERWHHNLFRWRSHLSLGRPSRSFVFPHYFSSRMILEIWRIPTEWPRSSLHDSRIQVSNTIFENLLTNIEQCKSFNLCRRPHLSGFVALFAMLTLAISKFSANRLLKALRRFPLVLKSDAWSNKLRC